MDSRKAKTIAAIEIVKSVYCEKYFRQRGRRMQNSKEQHPVFIFLPTPCALLFAFGILSIEGCGFRMVVAKEVLNLAMSEHC